MGYICIEVGHLRNTRGEPLCPRCKSSHFTYKAVFRYYKCSECQNTFITPLYNNGQEQEMRGSTAPIELNNQLFQKSQLKEQGEEIVSDANVRRKGKQSKLGWLIFSNMITILLFIIFIIWVFYSDLIELFNGLLESIK